MMLKCRLASISKIEGHNWRHGDIEDMLKTVAFIKGHKWTSMMIKRVYFGNWLRDYSQAMDVGSLKGVQAGTVRILVWVLSFLVNRRPKSPKWNSSNLYSCPSVMLLANLK